VWFGPCKGNGMGCAGLEASAPGLVRAFCDWVFGGMVLLKKTIEGMKGVIKV
jgi:hypothetical protein